MEIDGPNAEQLVFVLYGKILQDEDNSRKKENLSLVQNKANKPYISHSQSQRPSDHTYAERFLKVKREGVLRLPIVGDVSLPIGLFARLHLV